MKIMSQPKNNKPKRSFDIKTVISIVLLVIVVIWAIDKLLPKSEGSHLLPHSDQRNAIVTTEDSKYTLDQVLIVSRHNIRAPLLDGNSSLTQITSHTWFPWTANPEELSLKGGQLETAMGQFFREYLEKRGFMPENWVPEEGEVRFYTNSLQRTIATAKFFAAGMLPVANVEVEYHMPVGEKDNIFCPVIQYVTPEFEKQVRAEIDALGGGEGLIGVGKKLQEGFDQLEKVLYFKDSPYAKANNIEHFPLDDFAVTLEAGKELAISGGLKLANAPVDTLKLQIYENKNLTAALFGHKLSANQILKFTEIGDTYIQILAGTKTLATQVMNPLLQEMKKELTTPERKFTFLCGHDSTLAGVAAALGVKEYSLPETISRKTPIGGKLMFEKYQGADGNAYIKLCMCYNTTDQIIDDAVVTLDNPPMFYALELEGLEKNADGYYRYDDVMAMIDNVLDQFDDYAPQDADKAA